MPVVLRASIITPEAREVAELLGVTISKCDESAPTAAVPAAVDDGKTGNQHIHKTIITQLSEGQFTESLVAQLMDKVMKEGQSLGQGRVRPSFGPVTDKGGVKVINGSSVKLGRFDGAQPHYVGLADLVIDQDSSSMATGFTQQDNAFFPWTLNYGEIDMILEDKPHVRHEGKIVTIKTGNAMSVPKGPNIKFGTSSTVKFLYVAWPASWQPC